MSMDAAHRSSIYNKLVPLLGEDDANVLMSEFPSVEAEELVTKDFLRAELALTKGELRAEMSELGVELRAEMSKLGVELRAEMSKLGVELREEMSELGVELREEMSELGVELREEMSELRGEMAGFRADMSSLETRLTIRMGAALAASTAFLATLNLVG